MKMQAFLICSIVAGSSGSIADASASEIFLMCNIFRDTVSEGVHQKSAYKLRLELDDDRRTVKADDMLSSMVVISKYSDLSIEGSMGPFNFAVIAKSGISLGRQRRTPARLSKGESARKSPDLQRLSSFSENGRYHCILVPKGQEMSDDDEAAELQLRDRERMDAVLGREIERADPIYSHAASQSLRRSQPCRKLASSISGRCGLCVPKTLFELMT
jgi:hypothetical protein